MSLHFGGRRLQQLSTDLKEHVLRGGQLKHKCFIILELIRTFSHATGRRPNNRKSQQDRH